MLKYRKSNSDVLEQIRSMSTEDFKHFKLKIVDNVGVITMDSPGVKVRVKSILPSILTTYLLCYQQKLN